MTKQYPTKQYLSEVISNREFAESVPPEIVIVMARQLLAGMEQEPLHEATDWKVNEAIARMEDEADMVLVPRGLLGAAMGAIKHPKHESGVTIGSLRHYAYKPKGAAPQLPQPAVVDDDKFRADFERWMVEDEKCIVGSSDPYPAGIESRNWRAWNACRAAMLQGAEPVQGWIPCSERMPEEIGRYWCYVEEQNSLGKSHYQWNCSWNGDRWWVESENGGRVTHWMPLPAAPQQEVK